MPYPYQWTVTPRGPTERSLALEFPEDAPTGLYEVSDAVALGNNSAGTGSTVTSAAKLAVLLNPYASRDAVYISPKMHAEYAGSTSGLTWQGLSDKNEGQSFEYSQSQWETLAAAMRGLRRIPTGGARRFHGTRGGSPKSRF